MYELASGALALSLLYALYVVGNRAEPEEGDPDDDAEKVLAMSYRETGIPTHILTSNVRYLNERDRRGREKAVLGTSGDPYIDAARMQLVANQAHLDEVTLASRSVFNIPQSTIKPTTVNTIGGTLPFLPDDYIFQYQVGAHPKIGGVETPN